VSAMDRVKAAWLALIGSGVPAIDYYTTYRCKVVSQSADFSKVDLIPDDPRIPQHSQVQVKWGLPGVKASIAPGAYMHIGWANGSGAKPYACFIEGGATQIELTIEAASAIYLGNKTNAVELATKNHVHLAGSISAPSGGGTCTGSTAPPTAGPGMITTITKGA